MIARLNAMLVLLSTITACSLAATGHSPANADGQPDFQPLPDRVKHNWVDVTAEPYNADPTGKTDSTDAILQAMKYAQGRYEAYQRVHNRINIVYFPAGTYTVSKTLHFDKKKSQYMILMGDGPDKSVISLADKAEGFTNADEPKAVITFLQLKQSNGSFWNSVIGLGIDVGAGNPGAIGVEYHANNMGVIRHVAITSSDPDGAGAVGLSMSGSRGGIAYAKNVTIKGFDTGVLLDDYVMPQVMEHITLQNQRRAGIWVNDKPLEIRKLTSINTVPAIVIRGRKGHVVILDSDLTGGSEEQPAIDVKRGLLFARDVRTSGYAGAVRNGRDLIESANIDEYLSSNALSMPDGSPIRSLDLPIKETPDVPMGDPADWALVDLEAQDDDTAAIQAAIDSGAETVYLLQHAAQISDTIHIRGNVRYFHGGWTMVQISDSLKKQDKPVFHFHTTKHPVVVMDAFDASHKKGAPGFRNWRWVQNDAENTVVIRDVMFGHGRAAYRNKPGAGELFLEAVASGGSRTMWPPAAWEFTQQTVWCRDLNAEEHMPALLNDGGQVWILGFKFGEQHGPYVEARNGAKTELLGGIFNSGLKDFEKDPDRTIITNVDSDLCITAAERNQLQYGWHPYIIIEKRGEQETRFPDQAFAFRDKKSESVMIELYRTGATCPPDAQPGPFAKTKAERRAEKRDPKKPVLEFTFADGEPDAKLVKFKDGAKSGPGLEGDGTGMDNSAGGTLEVVSARELDGTTSFTISGWFKRNKPLDQAALIHRVSNFRVKCPNGRLELRLYGNKNKALGDAVSAETARYATVGKWVFFAITWRASDGRVAFYYADEDNPKVTEEGTATIEAKKLGTTMGRLFWANVNHGKLPLEGSLDNLRIHAMPLGDQAALTQEELQKVVDKDLAGRAK